MADITLADALLDQLNLSDTAEPALIKMENEMIGLINSNSLTLEACIQKVRWTCIENAAERGYYDYHGRMKYLITAWYEVMTEEVDDAEMDMETDEHNNLELTQEDMHRIDVFYLGKDLEMVI